METLFQQSLQLPFEPTTETFLRFFGRRKSAAIQRAPARLV
ncbi:Hypothetical protein AA314_01695 [Archangium gephyra]|uniref:Uncharacterized protein n=1 Tax=Archangium gephyra TaxID=48 RepID=A0AAC8Q3X3_9BACT|nr:Hypothetical protein AA314_01695 [Archangium gephyra]